MDYIYLGEQLVYVLSSGLLSAAVSDTSSTILSIMKNNVYYPQLNNVLEETDLYAKMNVIQKLLEHFPKELEKNDIIKTTLSNIHDIIISINNELQKIDNEINYHENYRYFSKWRTPHYKYNLKQLKKYKNILDERFNTLIKLINILDKNKSN